MKRKVKQHITQRLRQQRNIKTMLENRQPTEATHFHPEQQIYYKQENGKWFYFEHMWGEYWIETDVQLNELEQLVQSENMM
ncbi:hypothetical protein GCM10027155_07420 [Acinetobacter apis]|uniref:Uncharacterized protein n=1 Tax=Acinetobacter apis TaxID=1229165 RepID=A0A217EF44_9GAMM|nr:hypothetical protein [Acinetobacter apis]SNQ28820.1 hypothetical protein SAMN05444584_0748 [Acinetobacter apis]